MNCGLHLLSCYLPRDPFVDGFVSDLSAEMAGRGQRLILLPTYDPLTDDPEFIKISYTLDGYRDLARGGDATAGLLPEAFSEVEAAWTHKPVGVEEHRAAVSACSGFFGRLLDELEPDTVLIWNPTVPQGRLLQLACLGRAIPCFGIERGVFAETMMVESREVGAQADIALNPALRSLLASSPADQARFEAIRQYYAQRDFSRYAMAPRCGGPEFKQGIGLPADARVMVLMLSVAAANWLPRSLPGARFTSPWFASAERAVEALAAVLPADTYLVVQAHPVDHGHWSPPSHPKVRHVSGVHLQTLFDAADALAILGATTVQHEALLHEKPLLLLSRSQLSGQGVAHEYAGRDLPELVAGALARSVLPAQCEAAARYVPFLFDHLLFGRDGSPARQRPGDLARHLASLQSAHDLDVDARIERWLAAAAADLAPAEADSLSTGATQ